MVLVDQKKNEFNHGDNYDEQRWRPPLTMFSIGNSFEVSHEGFFKGNVLVQAFTHDQIKKFLLVNETIVILISLFEFGSNDPATDIKVTQFDQRGSYTKLLSRS